MARSTLHRNFILQQGLPEPDRAACPAQYQVLLFQPRVVGLVVLAGAFTRSWIVFAALAVLLLWSAALPRLNPFDAAYNGLFARRPDQRLGPAPAPRRFAQALAGTLAAGAAAALRSEHAAAAIAIEAVFLAAVALLVFGGFCTGSFVFHVLRGRLRFALRTLPWVKG